MSIGFIVNECHDEHLTTLADNNGRDDLRFEKGYITERRGGRNRDRDGRNPALLIGAVVLGLMLLCVCTYVLLKRRGKICKKRNGRDS